MADLVLPLHRRVLRRHALFVGPALGTAAADVEAALANVLDRHAAEWDDFCRTRERVPF